MKKIKYVILLIMLVSVSFIGLKAEENENAAEENQSVHETGTPLLYYLEWMGMIAMSVIVFGEVRNNKKNMKQQGDKENHEFYEAGSEKPDDLEHKFQKPVLKPVILILVSGLIFFCEQMPDMLNFHENLAAGYFRFIFKILVGVLMLSYGLSSMEEEHH